jgi:hypothetical protein
MALSSMISKMSITNYTYGEDPKRVIVIRMTIPNSVLSLKYVSGSEFTKGSGASAQYSSICEKSSEVNACLVC